MLTKIKAFWSYVHDILLNILIPLAMVGGYIYYILTENKDLKTQLQATKGQEKLNELQGEQKTDDTTATDAVDAFEALRKRSDS